MTLRVEVGVARRHLRGAVVRGGPRLGVGLSWAMVASAACALSVLVAGCAEASADAGNGDDELVEEQVATTQSALLTPPADAWNPPRTPQQWPLILNLPKPMTFTFDATSWTGAYDMFYCPNAPPANQYSYNNPVAARQDYTTFSARWSDVVQVRFYMTFIERMYCADGPPPEIGSGGGLNRQNYMVEGITSNGERLTTGGHWNSPVEAPSGRPGWAYTKRRQMKIVRMELDGKPYYLQSINAAGTRQVPHYQEGSAYFIGPRPFDPSRYSGLIQNPVNDVAAPYTACQRALIIGSSILSLLGAPTTDPIWSSQSNEYEFILQKKREEEQCRTLPPGGG